VKIDEEYIGLSVCYKKGEGGRVYPSIHKKKLANGEMVDKENLLGVILNFLIICFDLTMNLKNFC
jgi:hypothetical protein